MAGEFNENVLGTFAGCLMSVTFSSCALILVASVWYFSRLASSKRWSCKRARQACSCFVSPSSMRAFPSTISARVELFEHSFATASCRAQVRFLGATLTEGDWGTTSAAGEGHAAAGTGDCCKADATGNGHAACCTLAGDGATATCPRNSIYRPFKSLGAGDGLALLS